MSESRSTMSPRRDSVARARTVRRDSEGLSPGPLGNSNVQPVLGLRRRAGTLPAAVQACSTVHGHGGGPLTSFLRVQARTASPATALRAEEPASKQARGPGAKRMHPRSESLKLIQFGNA
jgi:hypothetical protein